MGTLWTRFAKDMVDKLCTVSFLYILCGVRHPRLPYPLGVGTCESHLSYFSLLLHHCSLEISQNSVCDMDFRIHISTCCHFHYKHEMNTSNQAPEPTRPRSRSAFSTFAEAAWLS